MITYLVYIKGEEKIFHKFHSSYAFTKKENIGDVLYIKKDGKIHSITIETLDTHEVYDDSHCIRIQGKFNKLFS